MSNFKKDLQNEKILSQYLDDVYNELGLDYERVTDLETQKKGVDIRVCDIDYKYCVDEKAQLSYINKKIPTFAFEISYGKFEDRKTGWFINDTLKTDKYHLVFNIQTDGKTLLESKEDILGCQIMEISKRKLQKLLMKMGITSRLCKEYEKDAIKHKKWGKIYIPQIGGAYFYFTYRLWEKPFNLIIKKQLLESVGTIIWDKTL